MNERIGKRTSSSMPLTRKPVKYFNCAGRFSDLPCLPAPSHSIFTEQWQIFAGDYNPIDVRSDQAYSSGYCPGFTPGSLLSLQQFILRSAFTEAKVWAFC